MPWERFLESTPQGVFSCQVGKVPQNMGYFTNLIKKVPLESTPNVGKVPLESTPWVGKVPQESTPRGVLYQLGPLQGVLSGWYCTPGVLYQCERKYPLGYLGYFLGVLYQWPKGNC